MRYSVCGWEIPQYMFGHRIFMDFQHHQPLIHWLWKYQGQFTNWMCSSEGSQHDSKELTSCNRCTCIWTTILVIIEDLLPTSPAALLVAPNSLPRYSVPSSSSRRAIDLTDVCHVDQLSARTCTVVYKHVYSRKVHQSRSEKAWKGLRLYFQDHDAWRLLRRQNFHVRQICGRYPPIQLA